MSTVGVEYKPEIHLLDERRSSRLGRGQFARRFFGSAVVRARSDNASEHGRSREPQNRRVGLYRANQHGDKRHGSGRHGNPSDQDEFAAALDPGAKVINLRLELHDLVVSVAVVR